MATPNVRMKALHPSVATLPAYQTSGAAGFDLSAAIDAPITIAAGTFEMVATGLAMAIPEGFEGQVRPRSGLAAKHGITVLNAPGTVDCDYRGEVKVCLINHGHEDFVVNPGDRIAQMVIAAVTQATMTWADSLDETARGSGGYGSTGV